MCESSLQSGCKTGEDDAEDAKLSKRAVVGPCLEVYNQILEVVRSILTMSGVPQVYNEL